MRFWSPASRCRPAGCPASPAPCRGRRWRADPRLLRPSRQGRRRRCRAPAAARAATSSATVMSIARRGKIVVVIGGEHGDGENLQRRAARAVHRRLHGLRIGMHGEEGRAELARRSRRPSDRVADVVQLEIEENLLAGARSTGWRTQARRRSRADSRSCRTTRHHRAARPCSAPRRPSAGRARRSAVHAHPCHASFSSSLRPHDSSCRGHVDRAAQSIRFDATDWRVRFQEIIHVVEGAFGVAESPPAPASPARRSRARGFAAAPSASVGPRASGRSGGDGETRGP